MPQLDFTTYASQIFWLVVTFAALYWVMVKLAVPRIGDVLETRQKKIEDNLERAAELKRDAEAILEAYEKVLAEARADAHAEIAKVQDKLAKKQAKDEEKLAEKLDAMFAENEKAIDKATQAALGQIEAMATDVTASAVERLTGEAPTSAQVSKAVSAALKA